MATQTPDTEGFFLNTLPNVSASEGFQRTLGVDPHLARAAIIDRTHVALEYYEATKGLGFVDPRYAAAYIDTGYNPRRPPVSYVPNPPPFNPLVLITQIGCGGLFAETNVKGAGDVSPGTTFDLSVLGTARGAVLDVSGHLSENAFLTLGNYNDPDTDLYVGIPGVAIVGNPFPFDDVVAHYTYIPPATTYWPPFSTRTVVYEITSSVLMTYPNARVPIIVYHRGTFAFSQFTVHTACS